MKRILIAAALAAYLCLVPLTTASASDGEIPIPPVLIDGLWYVWLNGVLTLIA